MASAKMDVAVQLRPCPLKKKRENQTFILTHIRLKPHQEKQHVRRCSPFLSPLRLDLRVKRNRTDLLVRGCGLLFGLVLVVDIDQPWSESRGWLLGPQKVGGWTADNRRMSMAEVPWGGIAHGCRRFFVRQDHQLRDEVKVRQRIFLWWGSTGNLKWGRRRSLPFFGINPLSRCVVQVSGSLALLFF